MMGRLPSFDENGLKKGPWTPEEDKKLVDYISKNGHGCWRALPKNAGINRCGKSCRLRWTNYLRPDIKRGMFSKEEDEIIFYVHSVLGNKWSAIASHLPGRTDNEIKNYWNTGLRRKLYRMCVDPITHRPRTELNNNLQAGLPQSLPLPNSDNLLLNQLAGCYNALSSQYSSSNNKARQEVFATNEGNNPFQLLHTSNFLPQNLSGGTGAFQDQGTHMNPLSMKYQLDHHQGLDDAQVQYCRNIFAPFDLSSLEQYPQEERIEICDYGSMPIASKEVGCNMINNSFQMTSSSASFPRAEIPITSMAASSSKHYGIDNKFFINPDEVIATSNPPSASSTCQPWVDFMDDATSDSFWKYVNDMKSQVDQGLNDIQASFNTLNTVSPFDLRNLDHLPQKPGMHDYKWKDLACNMNQSYEQPNSSPFSMARAENYMPSAFVSSLPKHSGIIDNNFNNSGETIDTSNLPPAANTSESWAAFQDDEFSNLFWKDVVQVP